MPIDVRALLDPATTAVLTMELQRGITGDLAAMEALAAEVRAAGVIDNAATVCDAARKAGAQVVHCTAAFRPDEKGSSFKSRLSRASRKLNAGRLNIGQPGAEVMPELGPAESDIVLVRTHGMGPFTSTNLDQILRNMGVKTLVVTGNSINVGVLALVLVAHDLGYDIVVVRDAVAGVPKEYGDAVLENTIGLLATIVMTEDVVAAWS